MLDRVLTMAHIALALAGAFAFVAAGFVALETRPVLRHIDGAVMRAEAVESKINATAVNLDHATAAWADASTKQAAVVTGLAGDVRVTVAKAQGAIDEAHVTLTTTNTQLEQLGPLLASARAAADSVPPAVQDIRGTVVDLREPVGQATASLAHLDAMLSGPDLTGTLHNIDATTGSAAHISAEADKKFTQLVDPPPCKGRWCWAKRTYGVAVGAGKLAEPAYWFEQLVTSIR